MSKKSTLGILMLAVAGATTYIVTSVNKPNDFVEKKNTPNIFEATKTLDEALERVETNSNSSEQKTQLPRPLMTYEPESWTKLDQSGYDAYSPEQLQMLAMQGDKIATERFALHKWSSAFGGQSSKSAEQKQLLLEAYKWASLSAQQGSARAWEAIG